MVMLQCLIMLRERVRERAVFVDLSHQRLNSVLCYPHWFWINFSQSYNLNHVYKSQAGESPLALGKAFIFYITPFVVHMNVFLAFSFKG